MTAHEFSGRIRRLYETHAGAVMMAFYGRQSEHPDEEVLLGKGELCGHITFSEELEKTLPCSLEEYRSHVLERMLSEETSYIRRVGDKYGLTSYGHEFLKEAHKIITIPIDPSESEIKVRLERPKKEDEE